MQGSGWLLFVAVRSVVPAAALALVVAYAVWRVPRLHGGVYVTSLLAILTTTLLVALTLCGVSQASAIDEPPRVAVVGVQPEEVVWPVLPVGLAAALLTPLLALWHPMTRTQSPDARYRRIARHLLDLAALGALLGTGMWFYRNWPLMPWSAGGWGDAAFDPVAWRQAGDVMDNPRGTMVRSLLRSGTLRRQSRAAVVAVLGPPDSETPKYVEYVVGWYSGFGVDEDSLFVYFGADGRARGWALIQG